jgi:hypothetical protein
MYKRLQFCFATMNSSRFIRNMSFAYSSLLLFPDSFPLGKGFAYPIVESGSERGRRVVCTEAHAKLGVYL